MKKRRFIPICTVLASMGLLLAVLAGCGGQNNPDAQNIDAPQDTMETPQADTQTPTTENSEEDVALRVNSVEKLIEAIRPDAEIIIEPGRYDLTDFLADFQEPEDRETWNDAHKYVRIEGTYDGPELLVRNVADLYIEGGSEDSGDTEIVTQSRHATVLSFQDCSDGPFDLYNTSGNFAFTACTFAGSKGSGWYYGEDGTSLSFVGCYFGQAESNRWYWYYNMDLDESITFEDCEWTEVTEYPDFEPDAKLKTLITTGC